MAGGALMVARTLREGELLLVFSRPGELDDIRLAPDGFFVLRQRQ
jgi:hypothetical protein